MLASEQVVKESVEKPWLCLQLEVLNLCLALDLTLKTSA